VVPVAMAFFRLDSFAVGSFGDAHGPQVGRGGRFGVVIAIVAVGSVAGLGLSAQGRDLRGEDLHGADFAGAKLRGARLMDTNLRRANFRGADLRGANLTDATLTGADLRGTKLNKATLTNAVLDDAKLRDADLTGALLTGALVERADFTRADLTNATLDGLDLRGVPLRDATLDGTMLRDAHFGGADFTGARLDAVALDWAEVRGAIGLTDEQLAAALGVPVSELGRALKEHGLLELEQLGNVHAALRAACDGRSVSGAGTVPGASFHPMMVVEKGVSTGVGDGKWQPPALRFAELVACVDPEVKEEVEICRYVGTTTGQEASRTRLQHFRRVRVIHAATGATVADQTFQGPPPEPCPETTSVLTPIGTPVSVSDIENLLIPFLGQLPSDPPPPPTTMTLRVAPRSGLPGTAIRIAASRCSSDTVGTLVDSSGSTIAQGLTIDSDTVVLTVPSSTTPASYEVLVRCRSGSWPFQYGSGDTAFEVTKRKTAKR
jgi:uncharacterized protein YjbI with pentapeptide repeats